MLLLLLPLSVLHGALVERFPLARTMAESPGRIAVTPTHVWVSIVGRMAVAKVGLDGTILDVYGTRMIEPSAITADPRDGSVWYASSLGIGRVTPAGEQLFYYLPQLGWGVYDITVGSDDNLWVATYYKIFRITRMGELREFPMQPLELDPYRIVVGPDHNLWISFHYANKIGRMTPAGELAPFSFTTPWPDSVNDITRGSDGALWFATHYGDLYKSTPAGAMTRFTLSSDVAPGEMTHGNDGSIYWGGRFGAQRIVKFNPRTHQTGPTYPLNLPGGVTTLEAGSSGVWYAGNEARAFGRLGYDASLQQWPFLTRGGALNAIAPGPDQSLWIVQTEAGRIVRRAKTGEQTAWTLPAIGSRPLEIVQGPDSAMYFTEEGGDAIGKIANGVLTEIPVPTQYKKPSGITVGPDNNLWFTLATGDKIVRMTTAGAFTEFPVSPGVNAGSPSRRRNGSAA
ncbi:MAG TPA: hypothetical protein VGF48_26140 [Thermoanaerobaculia bacterium]